MSIILDLHDSAIEDLNKILADDPAIAASILALLEQVEVDKLAWMKLHGREVYNFGSKLAKIKVWLKMKNERSLTLRRINELQADISGYRIVYGSNNSQIWVLAIVKREDLDYDNLSTSLNQRIIQDWERLCSQGA